MSNLELITLNQELLLFLPTHASLNFNPELRTMNPFFLLTTHDSRFTSNGSGK